MIHPSLRLAPLALLLASLALSAQAGSSASSASSEGSSASVGSSSTSFEKSSDSSSKGTDVAEGEYRIIEVAAAEQRPGTMRLKLQALAQPGADGEFYLYLPRQALDLARLAEGQLVKARHRPYGMEFAKSEVPFFLVMHDAWYRELNTRAVSL